MPRTNKNQEWRKKPDGTMELVKEETVTIPDEQIAPDEADTILRNARAKAIKLVMGTDNVPFTPIEQGRILAALIVRMGVSI